MKPAEAVSPAAVVASRPRTNALADYVALTKPRLNFLVVASSAAGYYLGAPGFPALWPMAQAVAGTALIAGAAAVLNQVYERDTDALMRRTRMRPLPDGRINPVDARMYGCALAFAGIALLATRTNLLAAALALATLVIYVAIYTPLKRRTPAATLIGAVPGALPPLIGWTASHGVVDAGGLALFAIVFLWQIPHFMAIAWMCRDDYGKAGFPMLPVIEPDGVRAARQSLLYSAALLPTSLMPTLVGVSGRVYFAAAIVLGAALIWLAARFSASRSDPAARALFFGTITYLPLLWGGMIANKIW